MARRGQCRCGLMLTFRRSRHGYKMRCPSCGAVVRLRVPEKPAAPPVASDPPPVSPFDVPLDVDVELVPPPEEPVPELLTPPESTPTPRRRATAVLVIILGGLVFLGGVSGLTWWLLR